MSKKMEDEVTSATTLELGSAELTGETFQRAQGSSRDRTWEIRKGVRRTRIWTTDTRIFHSIARSFQGLCYVCPTKKAGTYEGKESIAHRLCNRIC